MVGLPGHLEDTVSYRYRAAAVCDACKTFSRGCSLASFKDLLCNACCIDGTAALRFGSCSTVAKGVTALLMLCKDGLFIAHPCFVVGMCTLL